HRRVATQFDVGENILYGCAHLGSVRGVLFGGNAGLQKNGHDVFSRGSRSGELQKRGLHSQQDLLFCKARAVSVKLIARKTVQLKGKSTAGRRPPIRSAAARPEPQASVQPSVP